MRWTNKVLVKFSNKEFDLCREKQIAHRIFERNNLNHVVPFQHDDIDKWRDSLHHGLKIQFKDTNIILLGLISYVKNLLKSN